MKKVQKVTSKKVASKKVKKATDYQLMVNLTNRNLKDTQKSLGACVRLLLHFKTDIKLSPSFVRHLNKVKSNSADFKIFSEQVRFNKGKNTTCPYYVLQALYRIEKAEAKAKKTTMATA